MLVSVVIPTHNMAQSIGQAIESVLRQTYAQLEIIVVDDASTDETVEVVAGIDDTRLQVIRLEASGGPSAARNAGIRAARGELIALLDADDVWLPTKLRKQVDLLAEQPTVGVVYCGAHEVDTSLCILRTPALGPSWPPAGLDAFVRLAKRRYVVVAPLSSMMIRRICLDQIGPFDEAIVQGEELDLLFRLCQDWDIAFVPEPLVLYRMTGHFNPEKRLGRRIGEAHETTIRRAFARLGDPPELEALKVRALADARWKVALQHYAMRRPEEASRELAQIADIAPNYLDFSANRHLGRSLAYTAWDLYDTVTPLGEALDFVEYVFDHVLSQLCASASYRRKVKGEVCAITAFDSHPRNEIRRVWRAVIGAILLDPVFLKNVGLVKLLWQVFSPKPVPNTRHLQEGGP